MILVFLHHPWVERDPSEDIWEMAFFEGENVKIIDKFYRERFNLWKFKIEMLSASMDLWDIIDGSEEAPPSNADPKVKKEYERRVRKAMSVIGLNLADNQLTHIKEL